MHLLFRFAGGLCLSLCICSSPALALSPFEVAKPLPAEEFAKKVAESQQEALRRYPDLANANSIFARAAKAVENYYRRSKPQDFEERWNYPLSIADETSRRLRAFSPVDPVFSEVVPVFETKKGTRYLRVRVTKMNRDGISIVHDGGTGFIHRDDLTDPQRDKYRSRWDTEVLVPEQLIGGVKAALHERDQNLNLFVSAGKSNHEKWLEQAKFDFEREFYERGHEYGQTVTIRKHCDAFCFRLYELAYAAQESGQREAMERIEKELAEPVPEPYKTRLKELDEKVKERNSRYTETYALLRGKECQLLLDGQPLLRGIPKRGKLGSAEFEILAPDHVRIRRCKGDASSTWVFKLDLKSGEATLLPEASKAVETGTVTFRIAK